MEYDLLLIDPEAMIPSYALESGLGTDINNRYLDVNPRYLIHNKFPNIMALGDCVEPVSYSSFYSNFC